MTLDTPIVNEIDIQEVNTFLKTATIFFDIDSINSHPFHLEIEFSVENISKNDYADQTFYRKFDFDVIIETCHYIPFYEDDNEIEEKNDVFVDLGNYVTDQQFDKILDRLENDVSDHIDNSHK